jgi:hypothetical protein
MFVTHALSLNQRRPIIELNQGTRPVLSSNGKRHIKLRLLAANNECSALDIDICQSDGVIRQPPGTADNADSLHLHVPPELRRKPRC